MDDLQFDKAEYGDAAADAPTVCAACQNALTGDYFHVNGLPFCASCKAGVELALGGRPGPGGFVRAVIGGIGGGIAGALLYYLVRSVTGYEIGIIAIAVGFLVGRGVRWGTGGRGGALYQALEIGLTYLAIVSTYVPLVIKGLGEAATTAPPAVPPVSLAGALIGVALLFVLILALPFLGGFENILGLVIIGIGVYEAWKINKRVPLTISGPFAVAPASPAALAAAIPATTGP
jgi:hypothetical protein